MPRFVTVHRTVGKPTVSPPTCSTAVENSAPIMAPACASGSLLHGFQFRLKALDKFATNSGVGSTGQDAVGSLRLCPSSSNTAPPRDNGECGEDDATIINGRLK